jgi:type II secretory pathway component GspD/PulD (secretin)
MRLLPSRFAFLLASLFALSACASDPAPEPERAPEVAKKSDETGSDKTGSDKTGSDKTGSEKTSASPSGQAPEERPLAPPEEEGGGGALGDFVRERSLQEQERKALAENYYKTGANLFRELRYREAGANLNRSVALDASNDQARELRDRCLWILGDRRAEYRDAVRTMVQERLAKIDQARVEMERLFHEGEMLMKRQRYDRAQERFARVLEAIRWFPYDIDREGLAGKARARIAEARRLAEEQERRRLQMLQEAARQAAEHEKARTRRFRASTIKSLLEDAKEAFRVGKYEKVVRLTGDILRQQPDSTAAVDLRKAAISERQRKKNLTSYRDKLEAWRRQIEWVDSAAVPYQEIFRFPDREAWGEIESRDLPITELISKQRDTEDTIDIKNRLDSQQISLNFDGTAFDEAIDFLRDITGLNYVVTKDAKDLIENESVTVSLRLKNISLKNALNLILASNESLQWRIESGVLKIGTEEDKNEELVLEFYDVNEIVSTPPDYPAPKLGLNLSGGGSSGASGGQLTFDDGDEDEETGGIESEKLIELIEGKLGETDEEGSVEFSGGVLIVRKTLAGHIKIQQLLEALRRTVGIMVTVEARFVQVQSNMLEHIGVDIVNQDAAPTFNNDPANPPAGVGGPQGTNSFGQINLPRGTGGPGNVQAGYRYIDAQGQADYRAGIVNSLSSLAPAGLPFNISPTGGLALQYNFIDDFQLQAIMEMVRKTQKSRLVNAPRLTVFNGQRSHILNIRQRAYIQDVEVNQTGVIPVLNPVIGILNTGAILEVRPTVSHDRRYVSLEVQPTLATELAPRIPAPVTLANAFTSIPIELPVITIQKLRATITVPDGGTVLLGGLKNFDEFEGVSGVPFLMHVPLLNNLFRRQAMHKLRASLVVLVKANITIIREEEKRIFGRN